MGVWVCHVSKPLQHIFNLKDSILQGKFVNSKVTKPGNTKILKTNFVDSLVVGFMENTIVKTGYVKRRLIIHQCQRGNMKKIIIIILMISFILPVASYGQQKEEVKKRYFISYAVHTLMNDGSMGSQGRVIHATFGNIEISLVREISSSDIVAIQQELQKQYPGRRVVVLYFQEFK